MWVTTEQDVNHYFLKLVSYLMFKLQYYSKSKNLDLKAKQVPELAKPNMSAAQKV